MLFGADVLTQQLSSRRQRDMGMTWQIDINVFAERLKADLNLFYTEFEIISVIPLDREQIHGDWRLSLTAFRGGDSHAFAIPAFSVSSAMVWNCRWLQILDLLHNMARHGYDHLKEAA